eukprot:gb/GEZN01004045.1/.p1 GENE.gb/GEZN01004045.1/~~gb/GEZN01004045.1/.p1  ORF type:complete len:579 (+),score=85.08 gb/GEZN01004045.1/:55-1791(+)
MPPFVVRVRAQKGMKRLVFKDDSATFVDLQLQIKDVLGLSPSQQLLSRKPLHAPDIITAPNKKTTLRELGLKHGDMIFLGGEETAHSDAKFVPSQAPRLTPQCQHGPRGQCIHCNHVKAGETIKAKCAHGPHETCINCSVLTQSGTKDIAEFWCNHPETAFCPKCIPPADVAEGTKKELNCECDPAKHEKCLRCLGRGGIKTNFISFFEYMEKRRSLCKYKHASGVTCIECRSPTLPSYAGKKNCDRGHRPWPEGVCLNCAPETPHLRLQKYRHCDTISVPQHIAQEFYKRYFQQGINNHRVAFLFGRYMDEPKESKVLGGIRAVVEALYEPPQESKPDRVRFLRDPREANIHQIAKLFGLEIVGWIIARPEKSDKKYQGKVFMSGREVRAAAQFQQRFHNTQTGYSRFVTVVLEHAAQVEALAYQVSDQCVALERDHYLSDSKDHWMLATRPAKPGDMGNPGIVYKDQRLKAGDEFLTDECLVKCIVSTGAGNGKAVFRSNEFPSNGEDAHARSYLAINSQKPYHLKLSDFNLLVYLSGKIGMPLVEEVCGALATGAPFQPQLIASLDHAFMQASLF